MLKNIEWPGLEFEKIIKTERRIPKERGSRSVPRFVPFCSVPFDTLAQTEHNYSESDHCFQFFYKN
jgi:hypothetical protein